MTRLTALCDITFEGHPPEGQYLILATHNAIRICAMPAELLPPCRRCGTPTCDPHGRILNKHIDVTNWQRIRIWCKPCLPLGHVIAREIRSRYYRWRWDYLGISACYRPPWRWTPDTDRSQP